MKEVFVDYAEQHLPETIIGILNPTRKNQWKSLFFMKKLMIDLRKIS